MKKLLIILTLLSLVTFLGCSNKEKNLTDNQSEENSSKEFVETKEPKPKADHVFPLTGIETSEPIDQRIVSVMINNHIAARPQSGLSQADIVFEILAEGNITRFMALFQSEAPEVVGPVRSAREYYFELAQGYDALYIFHGAAKFVKKMVVDRGIDHLDGAIYDDNKILFKRESFRKAPHNSYLIFNAINDVAEKKEYDILSHIEPLLFLGDDVVIEGEDATHVDITYPGRPQNETVEYKYSAEKGNYTRYEKQAQTVELHTDEPIEVENVFIVETAHEVIDDAGRRKVDITSGGPALLIQQGKVQKLEWMNKDGKIIPVRDGQPVGFVKGKTWINIVPSNPGIGQIVKVSNE